MTPVKHLIALLFATAAVCTSARPSILSVADHVNDSTVVFPESVETDTHKMMQNWYLQTYTALDKDVDSRPDVTTSDEELIKRLKTIPTVMELPFNSVVRTYIDMSTGKKRSLVESMLGMSLYYMPIFEEALEREGLPIELKYLPVIESALNPDAVSRAGATGLWQIMLPTARGLGLEVNTLVDERRDPVRSSEAAARYLRQLYEIYKDWSLAIAAYNCGPGNVNKAMRRAGEEGKDFWSIYPYLPRETRGYVPCFIAATYVMNYYNKHNISPALAKRPILTDSVHVNKRVHFKQISEVLHIPVEALQTLNPQYRKQEIPGDVSPCPLVLPANQTYSYIMSEDAILAYDAAKYARRDVVEPATGIEPRQDTVNGQEGEWVTTEDVRYHKVKRNETMASIARKYGITLSALKSANGNIRKPRRGQSLKIVTTKRVFKPYETEPQPQENDNLLVRNPETADELTATAETPVADNATEATADATAEIQVEDMTATGDTSVAPAVTTAVADTDTTAVAATTTSTKVADTFRGAKAKQEAANAANGSAKATTSNKNADTSAKAKTTGSKKNDNKKQKKASSPKTHTVKAGESLYKIAERNGTTVKELQRLNNIKGNKIKPGDKIRVK